MGTTANAVHREPWNKGKIVGQKARNASSIHAWMKASGGLDGSGATRIGAPLSMNERQELIELRRKFKQVQAGSSRFKQVQQEGDILAKATAWFAGKSEKTSMSSTNS